MNSEPRCLNFYEWIVVKMENFRQSIYEHKIDFKRADINYSLVKHNSEFNQNFNHKDSEGLHN